MAGGKPPSQAHRTRLSERRSAGPPLPSTPAEDTAPLPRTDTPAEDRRRQPTPAEDRRRQPTPAEHPCRGQTSTTGTHLGGVTVPRDAYRGQTHTGRIPGTDAYRRRMPGRLPGTTHTGDRRQPTHTGDRRQPTHTGDRRQQQSIQPASRTARSGWLLSLLDTQVALAAYRCRGQTYAPLLRPTAAEEHTSTSQDVC